MLDVNITTQADEQSFENKEFDCFMASSDDASSGMNDFIIRLHETLDIYRLFDIFVDELRATVMCDSIEYNHNAIKTSISTGNTGRQRCVYALRYKEESLGSIAITRDSMFMEHEVETIEVMLAGLTLPLRNALIYKNATNLSQRDDLTGLRNEIYFRDFIELEVKRAQRYKKSFSLLVIEVDNFGDINSQYGHRAGNAVLIEVAKRIEKKIRSSDAVFRNGNNGFSVILPDTEKTKAIDAIERIKEFVQLTKCCTEDNSISFTLNVGVATVTYQDTTNTLIDRASKSLAQVKTLCKNSMFGDLLPGNIQAG